MCQVKTILPASKLLLVNITDYYAVERVYIIESGKNFGMYGLKLAQLQYDKLILLGRAGFKQSEALGYLFTLIGTSKKRSTLPQMSYKK